MRLILNRAPPSWQDNFTFPLFKRTGERVEVLLNATTRRNASGEIVGVVGGALWG